MRPSLLLAAIFALRRLRGNRAAGGPDPAMDDGLTSEVDHRGRPRAAARLAHRRSWPRSPLRASPVMRREIAREGALLDPDAALGRAGHPRRHVSLPGDQARQRKVEGLLDYVVLPRLHLPGSRPAWPAAPDQAQRLAALCRPDFPGRRDPQRFPRHARARRRKPRACNMARTETRDIAGYVERIGAQPLAAGDAASRISNRGST